MGDQAPKKLGPLGILIERYFNKRAMYVVYLLLFLLFTLFRAALLPFAFWLRTTLDIIVDIQSLFFMSINFFIIIVLIYIIWALKGVNDIFKMSMEIFVLSILIFLQWMFEISNDFEDICTKFFNLSWAKTVWGFGQMILDLLRVSVFLLVADVYTILVALRNKQFRLFVFPTENDTRNESSSQLLAEPSSYLQFSLVDSFEVVLSHDELCDAFGKFLKRSFCSETLFFIKDIRKLKQLTKYEETVSFGQTIVDTYFAPRAPLLLNLSSGVPKRIADEFAEITHNSSTFPTPSLGRGGLFASTDSDLPNSKETDPRIRQIVDIFKNAEEEVIAMLQHELFPRFVESKEYLALRSSFQQTISQLHAARKM